MRFSTKTITTCAVLAALALALSYLESFFPPLLPLPGVKKEEIQAIRYVATGAEIPVSTSWVHSDYPTMAFADLGEDPVLPDGVDTVIDVILKK